jgi:hypothetical protein
VESDCLNLQKYEQRCGEGCANGEGSDVLNSSGALEVHSLRLAALGVITLGLAEAFGSRRPLLVDGALGAGASVGGGRSSGGIVGVTVGGGGLNSELGDGGAGSPVVGAIAELL